MSDQSKGAGGSYIVQADGTEKLVSRTEPATARASKEMTVETLNEEPAAQDAPAPEAKATKKKET